MKGRIEIWRAVQKARRQDSLLVKISLETARLRWRGMHPDSFRARYARAA